MLADVAEVEIRGRGADVHVNRLGEQASRRLRFTVAPPHAADLVREKSEDLLVVGTMPAVDLRNLLADLQRVRPLMLLFVQLLEVDQRVPVSRIEPHDFLEGFEGAIHEAAVLEVERQAQLHVCLFELGQVRTLKQRLVHVDGAADLSFRAIQVAEQHLDLECVGVADARGLRQLVDRLVHLVVDEEVEAEHVVRRLAQAPAIDPAPVAKLVPLPRLADDQAQQQGEEDGQQAWKVRRAHSGALETAGRYAQRSCG